MGGHVFVSNATPFAEISFRFDTLSPYIAIGARFSGARCRDEGKVRQC
jgi:hypothetical protein